MNNLYADREIPTFKLYFVCIYNWSKHLQKICYSEHASSTHYSFCNWEIAAVNPADKLTLGIL